MKDTMIVGWGCHVLEIPPEDHLKNIPAVAHSALTASAPNAILEKIFRKTKKLARPLARGTVQFSKLAELGKVIDFTTGS